MSVFVVSLYNWDYNCDTDYIKNILGAFETLENAVTFSGSYKLQRDDEIEIQEWESDKKIATYYADGSINPY
jgi:hypothetical protein